MARKKPPNQTQFTVRVDRTEVDQAMLAAAHRSSNLSELVRRLIWSLAQETSTLTDMPRPGRYQGARQTAAKVHRAHGGDQVEPGWVRCRNPCCEVLRDELELS